jgi:hypothetical protein
MFHLGSDGFLKDQAVTLTDMLLQELEGPKWTGKLKIFETLSELVIAYATKLSQSKFQQNNEYIINIKSAILIGEFIYILLDIRFFCVRCIKKI